MDHVRNEDVTNVELAREVVEQAKELVRLEVALAREELHRDVTAAKGVGIAGGVAAVTALIGATMLLVALALLLGLGPLPAFIIGCALVAIAIVSAIVALQVIPKQPMGGTRTRVMQDVRLLKERAA
jgi:uncharacterized membrane protein YkgB